MKQGMDGRQRCFTNKIPHKCLWRIRVPAGINAIRFWRWKLFFWCKKSKNYLGRTKLALNVDRFHIVKANLVLLFYWKKVITEVSKLPPHYIAAMPDSVQEEIRQKVIAALADRTMEEIYRLSAAREAGGVDGNSCSIKRVQRHMAERGLRSVVEKKYRERGDFSRGQCPLGLSPAYLVIVQGGFQKCEWLCPRINF